MSFAIVPVSTHPTSKIEIPILLFTLSSRFYQLLESLVVDVGGGPLRDLVPWKVPTKLHNVAVQS